MRTEFPSKYVLKIHLPFYPKILILDKEEAEKLQETLNKCIPLMEYDPALTELPPIETIREANQ